MKLSAIPRPDARTDFKLIALVMQQTIIPVLIYRVIFDLDPTSNAVTNYFAMTYFFSMMGLCYATYRIDKMTYWKNMLLAALTTFAAGSLYAANLAYF